MRVSVVIVEDRGKGRREKLENGAEQRDRKQCQLDRVFLPHKAQELSTARRRFHQGRHTLLRPTLPRDGATLNRVRLAVYKVDETAGRAAAVSQHKSCGVEYSIAVVISGLLLLAAVFVIACTGIHPLVQLPLTLFRAEVIGHLCSIAKQCTPVIWQWSDKCNSRGHNGPSILHLRSHPCAVSLSPHSSTPSPGDTADTRRATKTTTIDDNTIINPQTDMQTRSFPWFRRAHWRDDTLVECFRFRKVQS